MSISLAIGELGATRQSWRTRSVRDLLAEIVKEYPRASDDKLLREYLDRCRNSEDDFEAAVTYAFDNNIRALRKQDISARERAERANRKVEVAKQAARVAERHADAVKAIKHQVMLLNLPMPNGKLMRNCTGEEIGGFGKSYAKIAQKVGPRKRVGEVLTEDQLHALLD